MVDGGSRARMGIWNQFPFLEEYTCVFDYIESTFKWSTPCIEYVSVYCEQFEVSFSILCYSLTARQMFIDHIEHLEQMNIFNMR